MNPQPPRRRMRSAWGVLTGLTLGLVFGVGGAWLFLQAGEGAPPTPVTGFDLHQGTLDPPDELQFEVDQPPSEVSAATLYSPDADPAVTPPGTAPGLAGPAGVGRAASPPPLQGALPLNPFGRGAGLSPFEGGSMGTLPAVGAQSPVVQPLGSVLETVVMHREQFDAVQARMSSFARDAGGSARAFVLYQVGQPQQPRGLLVMIPNDRLEEAFMELVRLGSIVERDSWQGSAAARRTRLASGLLDQRDELEKRRQELLVRWLEDAEPVKRVDDELAEVRRSLAEVELGRETDPLAVIKLTFR